MSDFARVRQNVELMAQKGAPPEHINGYLSSEGLTPESFKNSMMATQNKQEYDPTDGMGFFDKAFVGAGKGFTDLYRGSKQLLNIGDQKSLQNEIDESKRLDAPIMKTGAGIGGNVLANILMTIPTAAIPGANGIVGSGLIGSALGALNPVASDESRLNNMGIGAAGGVAGNLAAKTIGRIINPVQSRLSPELQELAKKAESMGINLDAADKTGSRPLKVIRSVMESLPLTADKQAAINELKRQAFNKAVLKNVGEDSTKATPEVLNAARNRIGGEFTRLTQNKSIPLGDDFLNTLANVESGITPFSSPSIKSAVNKGLDMAENGPLTGEAYQKIRSVLGSSSSDAFKGSNSELGQALKAIKGGLDDAAEKALPITDQDAWKQARQQWQALKIAEKSAAPISSDAVAGNISPAKFAQALRSFDPQGLIYGTRKDNMGDIARVGQAFVKEQIPNSGTQERTFWQNILTGNPLDAAYKGIVGGISMPAQAIINSKVGQGYLANGMIPLNDTTQRLAKLLSQGVAGGSAGTALLTQSGE